jgi:nicotinamide riboside transporter PnuC
VLDIISQIAIFIFGVTSLILITKKNKWGFVIALIGQPFYFYTTYANKQWGMFLVTTIYTFIWAYGAFQWFANDKKKK